MYSSALLQEPARLLGPELVLRVLDGILVVVHFDGGAGFPIWSIASVAVAVGRGRVMVAMVPWGVDVKSEVTAKVADAECG